MGRSRSRSRSRSPYRRERRRSTSRDRSRRRGGDRRRSRSRSPRRDRYARRSRSRSPPIHRRRRSRSPSPRRYRRSRTKSPSPKKGGRGGHGGSDRRGRPGPSQLHQQKKEEEVDESLLTEEEIEMRKVMGFFHFDSTKGKLIEENQTGAAAGAASVNVKRKYRQYMNRRGGFNRPLDFVA